MTKLVDLYEELSLSRTFGFFDDFEWYLSPHRWTSLAADAGSSVAAGDNPTGRLALTTGATDNNEAAVKTTQQTLQFAADKPLIFEARVQFTEPATNTANVLVGLMDTVGADALIDNGGATKASYSGAVFFKEDGQTLWKVESSIAAVKTTTQLTAANSVDKLAKTAGGASFSKFRIEFRPFSTSQADLLFFIDDVCVQKQVFSYTGAAIMQPAIYAKTGSANSLVVNVDYVACYQLR